MKRRTIGLLGIADFRHVLGDQVIAGVQSACEDLGVNLINFCGAIKYSLKTDSTYWHHFRNNFAYCRPENIDGLVTWASSLQEFVSDEEIVELHSQLRIPLVAVGTAVLPGVSGVYTNPPEGISTLVRHLVSEHGYRHLAFLGMTQRAHHRARFEIYKAALNEVGLPYDESLVVLMDSDERPDVHLAIDRLLSERRKHPGENLDALVTINDVHAAYAIDYLSTKGIRVPEDLAVTGYNNQLPAIEAAVPVTSVDFQVQAKAYEAVRLLLELIDSDNPAQPPQKIIWPSKLILRQSCGCYRTDSEVMDPVLPAEDRVVAAFRALDANDQATFLRLVRDQVRTGQQAQGFLGEVRRRWYAIGHVEPEKVAAAESLLHRAWALAEVQTAYRHRLTQSGNYQFMWLAHIALDFATVDSGGRVAEVVRKNLDDLEIPGIIIVLSDEPRRPLSSGRVVLAVNRNPLPVDGEDEPTPRVLAGHLPSRSMWMVEGRQSYMFEALFYEGRYYGYALMEMGAHEIPLYDTVRILLSHGIAVAHQQDPHALQGDERSALLNTETIRNLLETTEQPFTAPEELRAETLVEFLVDKIDEPTDLEAFAAELHMSRSTLIRKAQRLTGSSVQQLHELLKMERAKMLLDRKYLKVSEIAERLGYQSQFYFSKVFHRHVGMSPREWTRRAE